MIMIGIVYMRQSRAKDSSQEIRLLMPHVTVMSFQLIEGTVGGRSVVDVDEEDFEVGEEITAKSSDESTII
jgi:hypothetical protein